MHLLLPLASLLGLEAEDLLARLRQNASAWGAIALLLLVAAVFLLIAAYTALSDWIGPLLAPLVIAGVALFAALVTYLVLRFRHAVAQRRDARRRHAAERTAVMTTAAVSAAPLLLRSPLLRKLAIPVGGAVAAYYLLTRGRDAGPAPDER